MDIENLRLLVVGAGVNGSVCAVGLNRADFDVTVLARGKRYEELNGVGIEIEDPIKNTRSVTKVPVIERLSPEDTYDYIFVVVRKNQVQALLPVLAQNRSPSVVFMVNNPSGPDEWVAALGKNRVMLGFVFAGGRREGSVIRAMRSEALSTPFGEVDGAITARLKRLVGILRQAGFKAVATENMPDWLATHSALVAPLAILIIKHDCNTYALARSTADLRLLADAMREALEVLRAVGRHIVPRSAAILGFLPRSIVVAVLRVLLSSKYGEIGAGWHCSQAPDEMFQLARELKELMEKSGLPVPVLRQLLKTL